MDTSRLSYWITMFSDAIGCRFGKSIINPGNAHGKLVRSRRIRPVLIVFVLRPSTWMTGFILVLLRDFCMTSWSI